MNTFWQILCGLTSAARPQQWAKNVFVLFPAVFLIEKSQGEIVPGIVELAVLFGAFSLAASSVYLVNDVSDVDKDRRHPIKKNRAIASGKVSPKTALAFTVALVATSLSLGYLINGVVMTFILAGYLGLSTAYTFSFKHIPILDVLAVGSLYGIRVLSGFSAIDVYPPSWVWWALSAALLACAVELGKRKSETQAVLTSEKTRATLAFYESVALKIFFWSTACLSLCAYTIAAALINPYLLVTVPLVLFGIVRFWRQVELLTEDTHPQQVILRDPALLGIVGVFILCYGTTAIIGI